MATPEFVLKLREKIGHDLLWMMGITAYVRDAEGRVLLGQRSDTGKWALVCGIVEPGEEPADTAVREIREETGIDAVVTDMVAVKSDNRVITYGNGDRTMYMDHLFLCEIDPEDNAEPFVGDDESLKVGWFDPDDLPEPITPSTVQRIGYVHEYLRNKAAGDNHALFACNGKLH